MSSNILEDFVPEVDFARDNNIHPRTVARYRNQSDGLPYVEFGGKEDQKRSEAGLNPLPI